MYNRPSLCIWNNFRFIAYFLSRLICYYESSFKKNAGILDSIGLKLISVLVSSIFKYHIFVFHVAGVHINEETVMHLVLALKNQREKHVTAKKTFSMMRSL